MFADDPWTDSILGIESIELDVLDRRRQPRCALTHASASTESCSSSSPAVGARFCQVCPECSEPREVGGNSTRWLGVADQSSPSRRLRNCRSGSVRVSWSARS
jgi:hypothetical protein